MEELKCRTLQKEFEDTLDILPDISVLNRKTVLVTGATGLIGTQLVKTLLCYNRLRGGSIRIVAVGRNETKLNSIYAHLLHHPELSVVVADVLSEIKIDQPIHYIFHCASITSSKLFVDKPVETIQTLMLGTENLLKLAVKNPMEAFVYLSSLEVYGTPTKYCVAENDYGFIDFLNVRSSYSEGKRMAECLVKAYCSEYGVPAKIARLTQTIGCGIDYEDNRVFAQFAKSVIEEKNIVLHTTGQTVRSYCDICDAISALFYVLLAGHSGEAYNIANMKTAISIADMAQMVCDENPTVNIQVDIQAEQDSAKRGYNPEMKISLDTKKLELLGWKPRYDLSDTFSKLIAGLREKIL